MRFMIIIKATPASEAGLIPPESQLAAMARYHQALLKAGVLLDASALRPSARGWRVKYSDTARTVVDGPFADIHELIGGYVLIQVKSRSEAMEWVRRFPNPATKGGAGEIEVRPLYEADDFAPSSAVAHLHSRDIGGE